jgi:RNA polymerase sigma-70 factor (sigma-E family)
MVSAANDGEFCEFVAARSAALLRTAYLIVGDLGKAEDLLQTALVKTYLAHARIRDPQATEAYVRRTLVTTAASWWRRRSAREQPMADLGQNAYVADPAPAHAEADQMRRLLLTLPVRQRAVLVLRYYADMTEAEVAQTMGITRGTVARYVSRGLSALRARMTEGVLR